MVQDIKVLFLYDFLQRFFYIILGVEHTVSALTRTKSKFLGVLKWENCIFSGQYQRLFETIFDINLGIGHTLSG